MENQFKYLEYIRDGSDYYEKQASKQISIFTVKNINENWIVNKSDQFWTMYYIPEVPMIEQGFKIHISTVFEKAEETLDIVSKILIPLRVAFKHVKDQVLLYKMYSKHGSRISAGKFITIYPNEHEFEMLLDELTLALERQPKGPYILTDRRWKNGNVYYRYGAFKDFKDEEGRHCILDPDGNLIPDKREPKYYLPDFVNLPEKIKELDKVVVKNDPQSESPLKSYKIDKVIRFSNAGGIYIATRKIDNQKCIIKEARSEIGLDGQNRNAEYRLNAEYEALIKLKGVEGIVQVFDYFKVWENTFLVLEFVEGISLYSWASANYPFSQKIDTNKYFEDVVEIIDRLKKIIQIMHQKNVAMCDLQFQNVLIGEKLKIGIIDFEVAEDSEADSTPAMATRGFSNMLNTKAKDRDWYSLNRLFHFLLLPMGPAYDLSMNLNIKHCLWIYQNFGKIAYDYFYDFQIETKNKIIHFDKIFSTTFEESKKLIESKEVIEKINIQETIEKLKMGLLANCKPDSNSFINGDIRQFEMDCGHINIQNGGFGAVLALFRLDCLTTGVKKWINKQIPKLLKDTYNNGFLTGRSGIVCVLYECGYKEQACQLLDLVVDSYDQSGVDVTLRSGLAGIGIALACIGKEENNKKYLDESEKIAFILSEKVDKNEIPVGTDWQSYGIGLLDGYTGISVFLTLLYQITQDERFLELSEMTLEKELSNAKEMEENGGLHLIDHKTNRMYPYLSNGGIGLGLAIKALNITNKGIYFKEELEAVFKSLDYRIVLEPSFLDGISGFLIADTFDENLNIANDILKILDLFLIEHEGSLFMPGRMFYRLSSDVQTGLAGVILGLHSVMNKNSFAWLPMISKFI